MSDFKERDSFRAPQQVTVRQLSIKPFMHGDSFHKTTYGDVLDESNRTEADIAAKKQMLETAFTEAVMASAGPDEPLKLGSPNLGLGKILDFPEQPDPNVEGESEVLPPKGNPEREVIVHRHPAMASMKM